MRIYTLGTSHGDSTFCRFNSSTLYETCDGKLYLVDAGAPCEALIRRKGLDIKDVRCAFITHLHDDHAGGLSGLIKQIAKYSKDRQMQFSLFLPEETAIEPLKAWVRALHENADSSFVEYYGINDGDVYEDENLKVSAIRTCHLRTKGRCEGDPCSFAFILHFKKENFTVLHTGDLWIDLSDYPKVAFTQEFDLCLCEATHFMPEIALPLLKNSKFKKLIFIHVNDPWHVRIEPGWKIDNGEKRLLECYKDVPYPIIIAHDGDEFLF
jgi:ribonuclease BN (tRNA processing enzyme)